MSKYYIEIPYTGKLMIEIEAESQDAALEIIYNTNREKLEEHEAVTHAEFEEDYHEKVVQGNVFYGVLNELSIEELEEE